MCSEDTRHCQRGSGSGLHGHRVLGLDCVLGMNRESAAALAAVQRILLHPEITKCKLFQPHSWLAHFAL